jgi:deazaflavin-dependent oxidoreductase (nitroreductase family)
MWSRESDASAALACAQWYSNILVDPHVQIQIRGRVQDMQAHVAAPAERANLWERLVAMYRDFATYQTWTSRVIPVVVCVPSTQLPFERS